MIPMDRPLFEKEEKGMKYQFGQRKCPPYTITNNYR
jgi:hypothetical protein